VGRLSAYWVSTAALALAGAGGIAFAQSQPAATQPQPARVLPAVSADPLRIDRASDPVLQLAASRVPFDDFRGVIAAAVARHPARLEQEATTDEARALLAEARERMRPSGEATLTSYRVISREFSNDPQNIIERSRPDQRTDALLTIQQTVYDFGAGGRRVQAAGARLRAAALEAEAASDRVALGAIAAWYDMFAFRALVALTESFAASQRDLLASVRERVEQGVSAPGDVARVENYIASAETRLARFRRLLANAESRFAELSGAPLPGEVERAPAPIARLASRDAAFDAGAASPTVRSAERLAEAARLEARAARADRLPQVSVGLDAGRYGVFENDRDYDIRGRVAVRQRLFGGVDPRASQAEARARASEARADRVREEASRDAAIAWSDVQALEAQLAALEASYIAARQSRDVIVERFRAARGSLFDVVAAEDTYFEAAAAYIQAVAELDAARYVLLSRTGGLLELLGIDGAGDEEAR